MVMRETGSAGNGGKPDEAIAAIREAVTMYAVTMRSAVMQAACFAAVADKMDRTDADELAFRMIAIARGHMAAASFGKARAERFAQTHPNRAAQIVIELKDSV